jgi:Universal stress protein family
LGELAKHAEQIKKHAASVLNRVANAAKQAGVSCDTIQVENEQPYKAIITTAKNKGCDLIVMASHGRSGPSAVVLGSVTNKVLTHTKTRPDIRAEIDKRRAARGAFRPDHRRPRGREGAEWPSAPRWVLRDHDSPLLA